MCKKSKCKLCKPHKTWKKYSKFFNRVKVLEQILDKEIPGEIEEYHTRHCEKAEDILESHYSDGSTKYILLESGTTYMILNYRK